jgi:hypothetical protein
MQSINSNRELSGAVVGPETSVLVVVTLARIASSSSPTELRTQDALLNECPIQQQPEAISRTTPGFQKVEQFCTVAVTVGHLH